MSKEEKKKDKTITGKAIDMALLVRLFGLVKPYRSIFIFSAIMVLVLSVLSALRPWLTQYTIDNYISISDHDGLLNMIIIMLVVLVIEAVLRYYYTFYASYLGQNAIKELRGRVYKHITSMRLKYFDRTPIGTLTTRTVTDIETIAQIFTEGLLNIIGDILVLVAVLIAMFLTNWKLTLVSISVLPLLLWATYWFKEKIKVSFQEVRKQISNLNSFVQERITGNAIIQLFATEKREAEKFKEINAKMNQANLNSVFYYAVFFPIVEIITSAALGLMVWYGAVSAMKGSGVTVGQVISFILYLNMFFRPLRMIADRFNNLQMGMVAAERVFAVLDTKEFIDDKGTVKIEKVEGDIEFKNVWFAYNDEDFILKDISFKVERGKTFALVGATGAGKSSIISILSRFYDYNKGLITLDGIDIKDISLTNLNEHIGIILQDVYLFSGNVLENIRLRDESITLEKVKEMAEFTGIDKFINRLPNTYDYNVMERGGALSAGQRQLIAFLRAMVFNPEVLILDEATSSIDSETEEILQVATEKITKNRTSIVIAHRLSTIKNADSIIVVDKGKIVEQGTHQELLSFEGYYKKLYDMQFVANESKNNA